MKKIVKKWIAFLSSLLFCLSVVSVVFFPKDVSGIYNMKIFYEQEPNTIDIMFFGTSHVFESVNTPLLWNCGGYASFILGGSMQPMWNTYYFIKEALKYQHPKLIVLDIYSATFDYEYGDNYRIVSNTYGLKLSKDSISNLYVSTKISSDLFYYYLFRFPTYKSQLQSLEPKELLPYKGDRQFYKTWKGFCDNKATEVVTLNDVSTEQKNEIPTKSNEYLYKIIDLVKHENNVDLLFTVNPYPCITENDQRIFNSVMEIASENNIDFINFNNLKHMSLYNQKTDFADELHLNAKGNIIFTNELFKYLESNYNIPDRRNNPDYSTWEDHYNLYESRK